jgi:hypothetical protein
VTFFARDARVFPFQIVSRQTVVELLLRWFPVQKMEVCAVVLQVATHTILAIRVRHLNLCVIPMLGREPLRYFFMTIETFEGWSAATKLMAARTLRSSG